MKLQINVGWLFLLIVIVLGVFAWAEPVKTADWIRQGANHVSQLPDSKAALRCSCSLLGGTDDTVMGFDNFVIGEARASPGTMDSMLIPSRTACGPMRLRAWMGDNGP